MPSCRVTNFYGKVYIKGFSTILVPTKVVGDTVVWHMLFNDDGSHISYVDARIDAICGLYPENISCNLESFRHVLGWCPEVNVLTGMGKVLYITVIRTNKENQNRISRGQL